LNFLRLVEFVGDRSSHNFEFRAEALQKSGKAPSFLLPGMHKWCLMKMESATVAQTIARQRDQTQDFSFL
jgi:hypothetical protein